MPSSPDSSSDSSTTPASAEILVHAHDYTVIDKAGARIGTVSNLWPDYAGNGLSFIGIATDAFGGGERVVPADDAQIDHERKQVQLPLSGEAIKAAPDFNVTEDILDDDSDRIRQYYGYNATYATNPVVTQSGEMPAAASKPPVEAEDPALTKGEAPNAQRADPGRSGGGRFRRLARGGSSRAQELAEFERQNALLGRPLDPTYSRTNNLRD